ncbi:MAG: HAD family hydrolase [Bacilli bacterium]
MKLLVSDLDGTLLNGNHEIDQASLALVAEWCAAGHLFIVATGRLDTDIQHVETQLGVKGHYRISQNGCVVKTKENETVHAHTLPQKTSHELADFLFSTGLRVEVNTETNRHFTEKRPGREPGEFVDTSIIRPDLHTYVKESLTPTIYLMFGEEEDFKPIIAHIDEHYKEELVAVRTSDTSLEVFHKQASKGNAVEHVRDQLGIQKEDVYVVGDSENDVSMFRVTPNSFAMQYAKPHIQSQASRIVKSVGEVVQIAMGKVKNE